MLKVVNVLYFYIFLKVKLIFSNKVKNTNSTKTTFYNFLIYMCNETKTILKKTSKSKGFCYLMLLKEIQDS